MPARLTRIAPAFVTRELARALEHSAALGCDVEAYDGGNFY